MVRSPALVVIALLAASVPAPARAQGEGAVHVHVEADSPAVTLEQVTRGAGARVMARQVCRAPCDQMVAARGADRFFFAGDGVMASPQFHLGGHGGDVVLDVKAGSTARRAGGFALAFIGGASLIAGVSMLALGAIPTSPDQPQSTSLVAAGGVVGGVGLGLLVGGIVLVVTTRTTFAFRPPVLTF